MIKQAWDWFIILMVVFFAYSIINSVVNGHLVRGFPNHGIAVGDVV